MRSRRALALLRSQGLGLACGFAVVLLLAAGSFVLAATRDGASAGIALDDLRPFFARPSWVHLWLYLLLAVFAVYGVNASLATWDSVARKVRAGVRSPAAYGPALFHVGFLIAGAAHLAGGLAGEERGEVVVSSEWARLPNGLDARLLSLDVDRLPNGVPREARAVVETRDAGGHVERATVGYNAPLSSGLGADLHLLSDLGELPAAEISMGRARCTATPVAPCRAGDVEVRLISTAPPASAALVRATAAAGTRDVWLVAGRETPIADGRPLRLEALTGRPAIALRSRRAPGNPWALAAAVLVAAGTALSWRRVAPPRVATREAAVPEGPDG